MLANTSARPDIASHRTAGRIVPVVPRGNMGQTGERSSGRRMVALFWCLSGEPSQQHTRRPRELALTCRDSSEWISVVTGAFPQQRNRYVGLVDGELGEPGPVKVVILAVAALRRAGTSDPC